MCVINTSPREGGEVGLYVSVGVFCLCVCEEVGMCVLVSMERVSLWRYVCIVLCVFVFQNMDFVRVCKCVDIYVGVSASVCCLWAYACVVHKRVSFLFAPL